MPGRIRLWGGTTLALPAISSQVPEVIFFLSAGCISEEYRSMDSMITDTRASTGVAPLPA